MAKKKQQEKNKELSVSDKIAVFLQNNRKSIFIVVGIIAAGVAGSIAFFTIRDELQKRAVIKVEGFEKQLAGLGDLSDPARTLDIEALLEEINAFAPRTFGYAAGKAYSMAGTIYAARKEWAKAEESWKTAAKKVPRLYLYPVSLYDAAAAAEEQGRPDAAMEYYSQCAAYQGVNPVGARAQFSVGRLWEEQNNRDKALEAYRQVIEKWSGTVWANFAQTRIITLGS